MSASGKVKARRGAGRDWGGARAIGGSVVDAIVAGVLDADVAVFGRYAPACPAARYRMPHFSLMRRASSLGLVDRASP